jgi:hypothetical protein
MTLQLQFIRGTEQLFIDLALCPAGFIKFIQKTHQFYCEALEKRAKTDMDGLTIMDDWGTRRNLLIHPDGGCITQCEFGAGARPENVRQVFARWDELTGGVPG